MTELRIDGVAVELPASFSISIKRENPFFTKSGEYTYDIELPLENSANSGLYSFLNRINSVADIKLNRHAVLTADNRVYLDGTEVITGWDAKSVKIQLVSGNSEMNYLADESTLLSELNMISTPVSNLNPPVENVSRSYPEVDFCLPWVALADGSVINPWVCDKRLGPDAQWCAQSGADAMSFIPQPYLCAYIREVCKALGYTLTRNDLAQTFAKHIFIVHSQPTFNWSEMLPGITAREFLEYIEKTFNVSFKTDFRKKTVELILNIQYFTGGDEAYISNVTDEFSYTTEKVDKDASQAYQLNDFQLGYDFPETPYYNQACLSNYARNHALVEVAGTDYQKFFADKKGDVNHIFKIQAERDPAREFGEIPNNVNQWHYWRYVDNFREEIVGSPELVIKMPIIPAELKMVKVRCYFKHLNGEFNNYDVEVPVAADTVASNDDKTLDDILAMQKPESGDAGRMRMAIFRPMYVVADENTFGGGPQAFTDFTSYSGYKPFRQKNNVENPISLRPSEFYTSFYTGGYEIDIQHPVKIGSFDVNLYDTSSIYIIRNRRFLCREIEYQLGPEGRKGYWVGTFYPVRLADSEVYRRWILSDGRWRDRGVWIDDGRWLDDKPINHDTNTKEK